MRDRARLFTAAEFGSKSVNQLLQAANSGSGLCGFKDWRVPNIDELSNIVLREKIPGNDQPAIDTSFFPNTQSGSAGYLSATPARKTRVVYDGYRLRHPEGNLAMGFVGSGVNTDGSVDYLGGTWSSPRSGEFFVRLVRGAPALRQKFNSRYVINGDTVTDQVTQLMWQRCRYGRSGADCTTSTVKGRRKDLHPVFVDFGWREVLRAAASSTVGGFSDWRVPNINELESLLDYPSRSINSSAFPNFYSSITSNNNTYYSSGPAPRYGPNRSTIGGFSDGLVWGFEFPYYFFPSARLSIIARGWHHYEDGSIDEVYNGRQAIFVRDVAPSGTRPVAPGNLVAIADDSQVGVSWRTVPGATGYRLYYSQSPIRATSPGASPGVTKLELFTSDAPTISNPLTVYELTNEKRYYFRVTAVGADNVETAPSSQDSVLPSKYPRLRTIER